MTKKKSNNRKNFVAIPFSTFITLGTLGNGLALKANLLGSDFAEDLFVISVDGSWTIQDLTSNESPIEVGYSHSDYSVAEIVENLEIEVTSPDSKIEMEQAKRKIRRAAMFNTFNATHDVLNDGKPIRSKLKFMIGDGFNLAFWARNISGAALTTGALIKLNGTIYGRWMR